MNYQNEWKRTLSQFLIGLAVAALSTMVLIPLVGGEFRLDLAATAGAFAAILVGVALVLSMV